MAYTTINKSSDYFNTKLYTGNGTARSITGVGFQPDWSWFKSRGDTNSHALYDAVRGVTKAISSNSTGAEATESQGLTSFNSDGFSIGSQTAVNASGHGIASWNWKANGAGSSNTDGSITSTVSANTTSGFSIVKWTGNGTAGSTVGHGLGSKMKFMILKDYGLARTWITYHDSLGGGSGINFNETGGAGTSSAYWNNTDATSSVFSTGVYSNENNSNYICYCFAEKTGYSKFGSYTGNNNNDGSFIYTGFKPAFVLLKRYDSAASWFLFDSKRDPSNGVTQALLPNSSNAEETNSTPPMDFLSNGFKMRYAHPNFNTGSYIYMAFAEAPLVGTNGVTAKAR